MKRALLSAVVILLSAVACGQYVGTPTPAATPTPPASPSATPPPRPSPTATDTDRKATVRAVVYIREEPSAESAEVGHLDTGAVVEIVSCASDWCEIRASELTGYVWRGCLSDNPDGLRCEARP